MGTGWLLNRAVNSRWIVAYQAEKVHGKLHTVRPDEKLTRRPDAGLIVESSFQRLTRHFNNNHLLLREFRLSIIAKENNKIGMSSTGVAWRTVESPYKLVQNSIKLA